MTDPACRSTTGHTYVVLDPRTLRSVGRVTHRIGRDARVAGRETIRLDPSGEATSTLLGRGRWTDERSGPRLDFPGVEFALRGLAVGRP